jgi:DNA-binding transcriptional MerR regulator
MRMQHAPNGGEMTLLAPKDVGRRLRLSTSRVIQLDREGILRALRDSAGRRLYDADAVEKFALKREAQRSSGRTTI